MSARQGQELDRALEENPPVYRIDTNKIKVTLVRQINTPSEGGSTYPVFSGVLTFPPNPPNPPIDVVVKKITCTTVAEVDYVKNEIKCNFDSRQYEQVPIARLYGWYKDVQSPHCLDIFLVFKEVKGVPACRENMDGLELSKKKELLRSLMGVLRWLHWNNIFHNDLADRLSPATVNMLVDLNEATVCCIIDFGDSTKPDNDDATLDCLIADIRGFQAFWDTHLSLNLECLESQDPQLFECCTILDNLYAKYAADKTDALEYLDTLGLPCQPSDNPSIKCRMLFQSLCTKAGIQAPPGSSGVMTVNGL